MRQHKPSGLNTDSLHAFFSPVLSDEDTMGRLVVEILASGKNLNRKNLCDKLLRRIEVASSAEEERHYRKLIRLVLERDA